MDTYLLSILLEQELLMREGLFSFVSRVEMSACRPQHCGDGGCYRESAAELVSGIRSIVGLVVLRRAQVARLKSCRGAALLLALRTGQSSLRYLARRRVSTGRHRHALRCRHVVPSLLNTYVKCNDDFQFCISIM